MSNIIGTVYKNDSKTEYTTNTYLAIKWSIYKSGHVDVTNCKYPKGFDIHKLKEIIKEEINITIPTNMGIHSLS